MTLDELVPCYWKEQGGCTDGQCSGCAIRPAIVAVFERAAATIDDLCWKLAPLVRNSRYAYESTEERDTARSSYSKAHDVLAELRALAPKET